MFDEPRELRALGDVYANVWQVAYVTRDLNEGMALLRKHYGVESTEVPTEGARFLVGDEPAPWDVRISMGARGGLIVELIEPVDGEVDFYRRFLPPDGSNALGFHHLAAHMPLGDEAWEALGDVLAAAGLKVDYTVLIPDRVRAGYVDTTAELGHFLEICQLQPADIEFFSGLVAAGA
jgi:glyoxalase/bleomycin resistance protein/dioxygenase superfamily protein